MNEMNVNTEQGVINIRVVDITPEYAKELLKLNISNRKPKKNRILMYASDMLNEQWKSNGVPIIIGSDNILKDGQHRLAACVKANKTLKNMILIRVPDEQTSCYDIGVGRTLVDTAVLMKKEQKVLKSSKVMAALKCSIDCEFHGCTSSVSKSLLIDEAERNIEGLSFISTYMNGENKIKGIAVAGVWGAILNAYNCGYEYEKLDHFCKVLTSGMTTNKEDFSILVLRNHLLSSCLGGRGSRHQLDQFLRTQNALYKYENGVETTKCCASKEIYYPYSNPNFVNNIICS